MTTTTVTKIKTNIREDKVVVFNLMINLISSERQMDLDNLGIDLGQLPSASRKLIQEKIFPNDFLKPYHRFRDRANACLDKGAAVRTEMGCVSSRSEAVRKVEELNAIRADWEQQLTDDFQRYELICNERIMQVGSEAYAEGIDTAVVNTIVDALRRRQPTWEEFKAKVSFKYSAMPINLDPENDADFDPVLYQAQKEGLVAMRNGVFGSLVQYLVSEANALLKVLNGRKVKHGVYTVNYRTVTRIKGITEKLHGLAFVHNQLLPLAEVIDKALAFVPSYVDKDLPMAVGEFLNLVTCIEAISDQHELLARLADKQPLVQVAQAQLAIAVGAQVVHAPTQPMAMAAQTNTAAAVVQVEPVETSNTEEVCEVAESQEAAPKQAEEKFMGLGFMGNNLFA